MTATAAAVAASPKPVPRPATTERLGVEFFERDPVTVATELVGCGFIHGDVGGLIVETEAYAEDDPACHAYVGRTARTEVLFGPPGRAYVYLSYGIHQLFNVVTEREGAAAAVLIRALRPLWGVERMRTRRPGRSDPDLCSGPGKLTLALGIGARHNRLDLSEGRLRLTERPAALATVEVVASRRIGISRGTEFPWRFCARDSGPYLSRPHS